MSTFAALPPPKTDVGVDLLGLDDFMNTGQKDDASVASTASANADVNSAMSSALSSAANSTTDLQAVGGKSSPVPGGEAPKGGFEGGVISDDTGKAEGTATETAMHNSNMGFFDRLVRTTATASSATSASTTALPT
jgi:hypothetical protein